MKRVFSVLAWLLLLWGCRVVPGASARIREPSPVPLSPTPREISEAVQEAAAFSRRTPAPDPERPMVALTFDDGPTTYTPMILDLLDRYGAKGTFFVIGSRLNDGTRPVLQRMADMGCDIGMHDLTHADLTKFSAAANAQRIERMQGLISDQITGGYRTLLLRPPYGSLNQAVRQACCAAGVLCVRWSVDTRDWSHKNPKTVLKIVQTEARDGAIILFHDRLSATVTALEEVIPYLQAQGYDLVTVTELLRSSGDPLRAGEDYRRKPGR